MQSRHRAFTLTELLVVIGIIALLIGILLPALSRAFESARSLQCANNVRSIMQAWVMYANDSDGILPACGDGQTWPTATEYNLAYYLVTKNKPNIEFDHGVIMPYLSPNNVSTRQALMLCPSAVGPPAPNVSYVFSADLLPKYGPRRISQIPNSSERIPLVEQETPDSDGNFDPDDSDDLGCVRHFRRGNGDSATGKGNYGYADGHVATLTPMELHDHPEWVHLFQ